MKKFLILLGLCALFGAGCKIARQGHQFVISSDTDATVIEGTQLGPDLRSSLVPSLSVMPDAGLPSDAVVLPQ